jgi:hypothetical protein
VDRSIEPVRRLRARLKLLHRVQTECSGEVLRPSVFPFRFVDRGTSLLPVYTLTYRGAESFAS